MQVIINIYYLPAFFAFLFGVSPKNEYLRMKI